MILTACPTDDRLGAFDRGEVSEEELVSLAAHLDVCPECVERLSRLGGALALRSATVGSPPDDSDYRRAVFQSLLLAALTHPQPAPGDILRDYRIESPIGRGGMGAVFKAVHVKLDRVVAVKVLYGRKWPDNSAAERFAREMKAVGRLSHPNIVQATDAGEADGVPFLVMEYVDGVTLAALVKQRGPLPAAQACDLISQAAAGLGCAHQNRLVHRDVKPSNLIRANDGVVKVLDLGLALPLGDRHHASEPAAGLGSTSPGPDLTSASMVVGTIGYMSPEQRRNAHAIDARADVFGLGVTLWYLLTGSPPSTAWESEPFPGGVPREVWTKFLATHPDDRFPDMSAVAAALAPFKAPPHRLQQGLLAVCALLAVSFGIFALARTPTPEPSAASPVPRPAPPPSHVAEKPPPPSGAIPLTPMEASGLQVNWAEFLGTAPIESHALGLEFALIPPGEFDLATNSRFVLTRPYRLSATVVTRRHFAAFVHASGHLTDVERAGNGEYQLYFISADGRSGGTRSRRDPKYHWRNPGYPDPSDADPVTMVSWDDAVAFCKWLSTREGRTFRLPTEAEWNWAMRAGHGGDELPDRIQNAGLLPHQQVAMRPMRPNRANSGRLNAWGVCLGVGVEEWCSDWFGMLPMGRSADYENRIPHAAGIRLTCGDSYFGLQSHFGARAGFRPNGGRSSIGFRVLCELP